MYQRFVLLLALLSALASLGWIVREPRGPQSAAEAPRELLRIDPTFFEPAAATGGDFYFWAPGEFARSAVEIPLGGEDLLLAYGELDGSRRFEIPVDTLLSRVEVFIGAQDLESATLLRPDGTALAAEPGVRVQTFEHMRIVTLEQPVSGVWRLDVRGHGLACVTARGGQLRGAVPAPSALEPIQLVDVAFVRRGGRPGHEGWFPLEEPPHAGEELAVRVTLDGSFGSAEVGFVGRDGTPFGAKSAPLDFAPGEDSAYATVLVPSEPFRAVVRGFDVSGTPFRRCDGPLFTPAR